MFPVQEALPGVTRHRGCVPSGALPQALPALTHWASSSPGTGTEQKLTVGMQETLKTQPGAGTSQCTCTRNRKWPYLAKEDETVDVMSASSSTLK